ncbi:hypothetical protein FNV43_RR23960 [Rhamnella rubrinervis]|uniref:RNase H type-1 domain-containing protein n=1 Tax=Rhamnella rubrinervis TaxID=2594499 RepID=A0A8K0DRI7_9ROSA|nr:hypothetical protein FNV43_RR23960 [Rhamnella rubrinervis]
MVALYQYLYTSTSVLEWATDYAYRSNWRGIVFETDAKFVVDDVLAGSEPSGWNSFENLNVIRSRFANTEWKLVWSPRETNSVADGLARFSLFNNVAFSVDELLDRIVVEQLALAV